MVLTIEIFYTIKFLFIYTIIWFMLFNYLWGKVEKRTIEDGYKDDYFKNERNIVICITMLLYSFIYFIIGSIAYVEIYKRMF